MIQPLYFSNLGIFSICQGRWCTLESLTKEFSWCVSILLEGWIGIGGEEGGKAERRGEEMPAGVGKRGRDNEACDGHGHPMMRWSNGWGPLCHSSVIADQERRFYSCYSALTELYYWSTVGTSLQTIKFIVWSLQTVRLIEWAWFPVSVASN